MATAKLYCPGCKRLKAVQAFNRNRYNASGYQTECRSCQHIYRLTKPVEKIEREREQNRERARNWYADRLMAGPLGDWTRNPNAI
jgi:hypothetical protein